MPDAQKGIALHKIPFPNDQRGESRSNLSRPSADFVRRFVTLLGQTWVSVASSDYRR